MCNTNAEFSTPTTPPPHTHIHTHTQTHTQVHTYTHDALVHIPMDALSHIILFNNPV